MGKFYIKKNPFHSNDKWLLMCNYHGQDYIFTSARDYAIIKAYKKEYDNVSVNSRWTLFNYLDNEFRVIHDGIFIRDLNDV